MFSAPSICLQKSSIISSLISKIVSNRARKIAAERSNQRNLDFESVSADQEVSRAKVDSEKLKASNFLATLLKIGNWESLSRNEGGLIAKCYYAKKKIVWEILDGSLKSKIELHWSAIVGIKAVLRDNESGILEIEVDNEFVGIKVVLRDNQSLPALNIELPTCVNLWINITVEEMV